MPTPHTHLRAHGAHRVVLALGCALALGGCDYLGIESGTQLAAKKEAEGKAVGAACRHANRAIEDCYKLNPKALKAAVFDGWRDMDGYMRENSITAVKPQPEAPKTPPGEEAGTKPAPEVEAKPAKDER